MTKDAEYKRALEVMHSEAVAFMEKFGRHFTRETKMTLLVRPVGLKDHGFVVTNDELSEIVNEFDALKTRGQLNVHRDLSGIVH